jgi:hypothetical protein
MISVRVGRPAPPDPALFYDEAVKKTPQQLVSALPIVLVFRVSEKGINFRCADLKIRKLQDIDNIRILKLERDPQFFQYIIIGHTILISSTR